MEELSGLLYLKNITKEQAIQIANLCIDPKQVKSEIEFNYFNGDYGAWKDKVEEIISIGFVAEVHPHKPDGEHIIVHIYPSLDVHVAVYIKYPGYYSHERTLGTENQYKIQQLFAIWKINPK